MSYFKHNKNPLCLYKSTHVNILEIWVTDNLGLEYYWTRLKIDFYYLDNIL